MGHFKIKKIKREIRRGQEFLDRIDPQRSFMLAANLISRPRLRRDVEKRIAALPDTEQFEGEEHQKGVDRVTQFTIDEIAKDFYQSRFSMKLQITELEELPDKKSSGIV